MNSLMLMSRASCSSGKKKETTSKMSTQRTQSRKQPADSQIRSYRERRCSRRTRGPPPASLLSSQSPSSPRRRSSEGGGEEEVVRKKKKKRRKVQSLLTSRKRFFFTEYWFCMRPSGLEGAVRV